MKKVTLYLIVSLLLGCMTQPIDIVESIHNLKNLKVTHFKYIDEDDSTIFITDFFQPIDHNNSSSGEFSQRVVISHKGFDKPVVLVTDGYSLKWFSDELASILDANLIWVNHRYYTDAIPDNPDFKYLTIEQAAADHHNIVKTFKKIYKNSKWVSTGASKGGMTALFFKRFYPDDVDAVVARVAPIFFERDDPRAETYFNDKSRSTILNRLKTFQLMALNRRSELVPIVKNQIETGRIKTDLNPEAYFEERLSYLTSSLWRNGYEFLEDLPKEDSDIYTILSYIDKKTYNAAFSHQQATELGGFDINSHLQLPFIHKYYPDESELDLSKMTDITSWLKKKGNNIIYIYGEEDIFTSFQVDIGTDTNALKIIQPGAFHHVPLAKLDEYDKFYSTLNKWLK